MTVDFAFGDACDGPGTISMGLPLLSGEPAEALSGAAEPAGTSGHFRLWRGDSRLFGHARLGAVSGTEAAAARLYGELLHATRGLHLHRIWNCVPGINSRGPDGTENYHAFCRARSIAFEAEYGPRFAARLPAASAVGTERHEITVVFVAGASPARNVENPRQTPAYNYPAEHGPRPPSFARATVLATAQGTEVYVSGTSSIAGHQTVAPGDTRAQAKCTLGNLAGISRACGLGDDLGGEHGRRHFKVYLRNPADLAACEAEMSGDWIRAGDRVTYLRADICRAALNVEVEVAVRGLPRI
ncbi:MAG TPA: hypothetical protein VGG34_12120 [Opitutaceae bacterium]|jgi:hypothetical protein